MFWRRRKNRDDDLERELRSDIELEAEEQRESGLSAEEAQYAAKRAFGNTTFTKDEVREMWGWTILEQIAQDMRHALRGMRKNPGFTIVATLSLALGIGATTAVFSVLNAVVFRPLHVAAPERLVILQPQLRGERFVLFNPLFEELRGRQRSLTGMFAVSDEPYLKVALDREAPAYLRSSLVSSNYFQVLGLSPALGRLLTGSDDEISPASCAAVISYAFWTDRFHRNPAVLGHEIRAGEKDCTIVGVAPAGFRSHESGYAPEVWLPLRPLTDPKLLASHGMAFFSGLMGRLRPHVIVAQAEAELTALYQRVEAAEPRVSFQPGQAPPSASEFKVIVEPGGQGLDTLRRQFEEPLGLVLAVTIVVLLIAAVNVSNLLLARGAARTGELATRAALGAGRARLMRQLFIEAVVLAGCGGLLGVTLALLSTPVLAKFVSLPYLPVALDTAADGRVLSVASAATLFAALLAGILPAVRLSGSRLQTEMAGAARMTSTRSGQRLAHTLVAGQLALSLLLVTSTGLLLRTMLRVLEVDPGFNPNHVVLLDIRDTAPAARFGEVDTPEQKTRRAAEYHALDQRLNALSGVRAAGISWLGLFGGNYVGLSLYDAAYPENRHFTLLDYISPRYFEAVGMQVLRGRGFTEMDRGGSLPVAVVNEAFVRERIRSGDALGRGFVMTYANQSRTFTVVGIVRDSKYNDLRERKAEPMMWIPLAQAPVKITSVSLRVQPGMDAVVIGEAEAALAKTSRDLMVQKVTTLRAQVDQATERERMLLTLSSSFGGLALLLAAVGLYGTLAHAVACRTREIGVRLALGAQPRAVLQLILGDALLSVAGGLLVGIPFSLAAGHFLQPFLFNVTAYDLRTLLAAATVLTAVAIVAAFAPARRASRVDPMTALRCE